MNISFYVERLKIINESSSLSLEDKKTLQDIIKMLNSIFLHRNYRKSPTLLLDVKKSYLVRVKDESLTKRILYIMQLNKTPVSYNQLATLLNDKIIGSALKSLINTGMIKRVSYAIYELTEKGRGSII